MESVILENLIKMYLCFIYLLDEIDIQLADNFQRKKINCEMRKENLE